LRPARADDLPELLALENRLFTGDRVSRRSFRAFLHSPSAILVVAEAAGGIAGYMLVLFRRGAPLARLYSIAVAPEHAGRGLGTALLAAAEGAAVDRGCTRMRLEVDTRNIRAAALYPRSGYRQIGRREGYYEDGGTALKLEKRLTEIADVPAAAPYC
jgi:ribosomal protein S18 acetylase RimI-like enzyme